MLTFFGELLSDTHLISLLYSCLHLLACDCIVSCLCGVHAATSDKPIVDFKCSHSWGAVQT